MSKEDGELQVDGKYFTGEDIKYIYELERAHEKNDSDCTGEST